MSPLPARFQEVLHLHDESAAPNPAFDRTRRARMFFLHASVEAGRWLSLFWRPVMSPQRSLGIVAIVVLFGRSAVASDFAIDLSRLTNPIVRYQDRTQISGFPPPVVHVRRPGLSAGPAEIAEITEKILYPIFEKSPHAISAVVLEWYPGQPDGLGVIVLWGNGESREAMIPRSPQGTYAVKAYEMLFAKPTP